MRKRQMKYMAKTVCLGMILLSGVTSLYVSYFFEKNDDDGNELFANEFVVEDSKTTSKEKNFILTSQMAWYICKEGCNIDACLHNREVLVSGMVLKQDVDIDKTPYLVLKVGDIENIGCYLKKSPTDIHDGDMIILKGIYKEHVFDNIVITDAELL